MTPPSKRSTNSAGAIRSHDDRRIPLQESELEDEQLLAKITRSDETALEAIYDKYQRRIYSMILRIVRNSDDAAEVMQDVFVQVWDKAGLFDGERGSFAAWLTTLAHNKAINLLRSKRFQYSTHDIKQDIEEIADTLGRRVVDDRTALDEEIARDEHQRMLTLLGRLPEAQRTALVMAYYSGFSQSEIAEALGVPLGTIKTRMRQGMIKLREILGESGRSDI